MSKKSEKGVASGLLRRALSARNLRGARRASQRQKFVPRVRDDAQLKLYGELLPGGFLHYGYFDDPQIEAREISLADVSRAQLHYAEQVLQPLTCEASFVADGPILDVGCGMGGLSRIMAERGLTPVALSPDCHQIAHIQENLPNVETHQMRFEDLDGNAHQARYSALVTAESLQYLEMDIALPLIRQILKPGGRWLACDYFRIGEVESVAETWDGFAARLEAHGFEVCSRRDITPNVLPTLAYLHLWGAEIARPIMRFGVAKIKRKRPGLHHLLRETLQTFDERIDHHLDLVDPATFAANFQYLLLEMRVKS